MRWNAPYKVKKKGKVIPVLNYAPRHEDLRGIEV
jgi:hypothetical protein